MKFESRIKHIEQKIEAITFDFCACVSNPKYPRTEIIYWRNGKPAADPDLINHTFPDVCESCTKPIYKMTTIVDFTDSKIPKEAQ